MKSNVLKIGNAGGYWGDDHLALKRQIEGGHLDYITIDFLAEVTMSIMQKQRATDPSLGYARDFVTVLKGVLAQAMKQKTCIISNAGGVNPRACAEAIQKMAESIGLQPKIVVVDGDDILPRLKDLHKSGVKFANMETGGDFSYVIDRIVAANAYFGAAPVVEALKLEPDIIVTGRVTDTGITLAPMIHRYGWKWDDWDKLSAGIVAGHLLECGSQATGGNFSDWQKVKSFKNMGYPIVEVSENGELCLTKHPDTGGLVSQDTVREQLFYEMGNPKAYLTPDVVADFSTIQLVDVGKDRVRIFGVKGYEPTPFYKVSMAFENGFKIVCPLVISGPNARAKAEKFAEIFWDRVDASTFDATNTEYFGWNACHGTISHQDDASEILLQLGARDQDKEKLARMARVVPAMILSGPPGVTVYGGVAKPGTVIGYWPALIAKSLLKPTVTNMQTGKSMEVEGCREGNFTVESVSHLNIEIANEPNLSMKQVAKEAISPQNKRLYDLCLARSGDKGDTANIGVLARNREIFDRLDKILTAQYVKNLFQEICLGRVVRYKLDNMMGYNFLLEESLGGGGTVTLRTDAQGKTLAQALLNQRIPYDG